ncbi:hypothetical protein Dsin_015713 [Dipteronia sinensis]|uniref:RNase H type-1 domain-containing protein n=1 Tax=Dipteronia sinensis TaxID=43782 RepID=A0AAE0AD02_9ROSI|nr:hypothetical protein Dsin_015713 [Dipteronia sinensis]
MLVMHEWAEIQIVWWFKHLGKGSMDSIDALLRNVHELCVDHKKMKKSILADWIPPRANTLKFNVDGSVRGKPGPAGIGGVLRDSNGKVLCLFSQFVGILDSNAAELWAIKNVVDLCLSSEQVQGREITVVSDSRVAVSWINKGDFGDMEDSNTILDIRSSLSAFGGLDVVFDSRVFNSLADSLAKMGANQTGDFVDWSDM